MGIKKNILYTSILTSSNYIFPLIVYPYVSRVLGVTNIGLCNFIDSVINYFIMFSMMGLSIVGTRQIAANRSNQNHINSVFSSLITLNLIFSGIAIIVLVIATLTVKDLYAHKDMMIYGGVKVLSNILLIEWLYRGIENFKFITIRSIIIKCLFVISIFIFVRNENDYNIYYLLTVLVVTGNALINFYYSTKFVRFKLKLISLRKYLKPFIILGLYLVLTSLYTTFNIVYLGFTTNDTQVGYYTTAIKLYSILLALFSGISTVLMPRMSNLLSDNKTEEFKHLMDKSISSLFLFATPLIVLTVIFAPQIIMLLSGPGYEGAITPMRIIMPLMLLIGYEQIQVIQCLMPLGKDKVIMINSSVGAIIGVILNLILVRYLASIGSAITWMSAEFVILILSQIALNKLLNVKFPWKNLCNIMLSFAPLAMILLFLYYFGNELDYWKILIIASMTTLLYFIICQLFILKNSILINLTNKYLKSSKFRNAAS